MDPLPDLPTLEQRRERDRERRGGAVPFLGRGAAPQGFSFGARSLSNLLGPTTWLGGVFASKLGPVLCLGLMLTTAAAGAGMIYQLARPAPGADSLTPAGKLLDGVGPSGIIINGPKNRSLSFVTSANRGEIQFERAGAPAPKTEEPVRRKAAAKARKPQPPDLEALLGKRGKGGLDSSREGFVRKMTKDTKDLHSGRFGQLSRGFGDFNSMITKERIGNAAPKFGGQSGSLEAMRRNKSHLSASSKSTSRVKTSGVRGQLAFAKAMSGKGMTSKGAEASAQYASNAFDQQSTSGGAPVAGPAGLSAGAQPVVAPIGSGAPDVTSTGGGMPSTEGFMAHQPMVDQAGMLANQASDMKQMAIMMMVIGAALVALGATVAWMGGWGAIIIAAGLALIAMGIMQMMESSKMAEEADKIGQQLQQDLKQQDQGQAVRDCSKVAAEGGSYDACMESQKAPEEATKSHVSESKPEDFSYTEEAPPGDSSSQPGL